MSEVDLTQSIRRNFPDVSWKEQKYFDHGWDHSVVILDDRLVFRAPKWEPHKMLAEAGFLKFLSLRVPVKLPIYKYITVDGSIGGYDKINGQELSLDLLMSLCDEETELMARQLAGFLTELHKVPLYVAVQYGLSDRNDEDSRDLSAKSRKLVSAKLSRDENEVMLKRLDSLAKILDTIRPSVPLHRDLGLEHILFDQVTRQVGVIDFGDMAQGDPAYDFVGLWSLGESFVRKVYSFYDGFRDEELIARSKVYFDCFPISLMKDSFEGWPVTFEYGLAEFRNSLRANTHHEDTKTQSEQNGSRRVSSPL